MGAGAGGLLKIRLPSLCLTGFAKYACVLEASQSPVHSFKASLDSGSGLGVEEFVWDASLDFVEAFNRAERFDFYEFWILGVFELVDVAELSNSNLDFHAVIRLS